MLVDVFLISLTLNVVLILKLNLFFRRLFLILDFSLFWGEILQPIWNFVYQADVHRY